MRHILSLLTMMSMSFGLYAQNVNTYIPPQAYKFAPVISAEVQAIFPTIPERNYIPGLIEHESCISLKHSKCWNSRSQLLTKRERGAGLGQITKAYHQDGSLRFDKLAELRTKYRKELAEASWNTILDRPDVQIRMIVIMLRDEYGKLYDVKDPFERLSMVDNAYNGGMGGLQKERRLCSLTKGCDPHKWFGHVEKYCLKSKKPLYGNRSVCQISRAHTKDVMLTRMPKYQKANYLEQ